MFRRFGGCGQWTSMKVVLKNYCFKCVGREVRIECIALEISSSKVRLDCFRRTGYSINSKNVYRINSSGIHSNPYDKRQSFLVRDFSVYSNNRHCWLRSSCGINYYSSRNYSETVNVANQSVFYKALYDSPPVLYAQEFLLFAHEASGLPWWATIVGSTIVLRTLITFPLALYQNYILAKLELIQLELKEISKEMGKETSVAVKKFNWSEKQAKAVYIRSMKKQWKKLIERENCHPAKASLLVLVQLPMWVSLSLAIRNLVFMLPQPNTAAHVTVLELSGGGALWFHNLLLPDISWILPVALGITNLTVIEIQRLSKTKEPSKFQKVLTNIFRGISIIMVPIAASVPSCLSLYWLTSSAIGVIHNLILLSPRVRESVGIPATTSVPVQPYRHMYEQLAARLGSNEPRQPPSAT